MPIKHDCIEKKNSGTYDFCWLGRFTTVTKEKKTKGLGYTLNLEKAGSHKKKFSNFILKVFLMKPNIAGTRKCFS